MATKRYFICHSDPKFPTNPQPGKLQLPSSLLPTRQMFEVHLLDEDLRTISRSTLDETEHSLVIEGVAVPNEVVVAVKQLLPNTAIFVDENGREIHPF